MDYISGTNCKFSRNQYFWSTLISTYKCATHSRKIYNKDSDALPALLRGSNRISRVSYLGTDVLPFHGRKSTIEDFFVRRERVAYTEGFRQTKLLGMKRRRNLTCPRLFRERRKVDATILHEVISFLSPNDPSSFASLPFFPSSFSLLCLSLPPSLLRSEKGRRLARPWVKRPHSFDRPCSSGSTSWPFSGDIKRLLGLVVSPTILFRPTDTLSDDDPWSRR